MTQSVQMEDLKQMATIGVEAESEQNSDFVRASDNQSDPVGQYKGDWGFWDECWCDWHGGYADEADARKGLATYCREVLGDK